MASTSPTALDNWVKKAEDQEISSLVNELNLSKDGEAKEGVAADTETTADKTAAEDSTRAATAVADLVEKSNDEKAAASENGETASSTDEAEAFNPADASLLMKIIRKGLVESKLDLEVQRKDPSSPLYSVKTFEALHLKPELLQGCMRWVSMRPLRFRKRHCLHCWPILRKT